MSADPLAITFAKADDGSAVLAKVLHVDLSAEWPLVQRVETSPQITRHRFRSRVVRDLPDMLSALRGAAIAGEIAVRGEPRALVGRRAIYDDREKGPAGLDVAARQWVGFDWDSVPLPEGVDPLLNPEAIPPIIMKRLPPPFRVADCVVQISASAGVKPGARARTWHLLDRPLAGTDLKLWCRPAIERHLLDPVTLVETQPHYLSITVRGGHDPCPERFTLYRAGNGVEFVDCTDFGRVQEAQRIAEARGKAERERMAKAMRQRLGTTAPRDERQAYELSIRKAERAIVGSGKGSRHPVYVEQMARMRAICERHGHDFGKARDRLRAAYVSILTPDEARQRQRGSTDGRVRWLEARP
jgi:hypothetical protein